MSAGPQERAVVEATRALRERPSALVSDIDGTLSPIVATPEEAVVLPECRAALRTLAGLVDIVAITSGRTAAEARRMVGLDELLYVGNHGLERWDRVDGYRNEAAAQTGRPAFEDDMRAVRRKLEAELRALPEVRIEDKGVVLSLHYRGAQRPDEVRQRLLEALEQTLPQGRFAVAEGKMVVEVRPPLALDKGTVIEGLVAEKGLRGVVFLGDDVTDLDAMRALRRLRSEGLACLVVGVAGEEAPTGLVEESDVMLADPQAVAVFLEGIARSLSPPS